jgi:hypothetical protein
MGNSRVTVHFLGVVILTSYGSLSPDVDIEWGGSLIASGELP